nr:phosphatase 2C 53 [Ipomoea batatas]
MSIAVVHSPVFSPSPVFSKSSASSPIGRSLYASSSLSPSTVTPPPSTLCPLTLRRPIQTRNIILNGINEEPICSTSSTTTTTTPVLKRKRPARINIPMAALSFEPSLQTPRDGDRLDEVEVEGEGYSVYCKRGKRGAMEDRYSAFVDHQQGSKQAFFGVFDGHGGVKAAEFAARNMGRNIMNKVGVRSEEDIEAAVKEGYLATDEEFLKQNVRGGASCVTALIHKGKLVVSNAGDCRAVMSRGGIAEVLTLDHRPSRESEKERIEALGGYVDCCRGVWRIQGSLAVSRGIGDAQLKKWVIAEPETKTVFTEPDFEFLILASDGVWDKVSNQEAVDTVRPLCIGVDKPHPLSACKELVNLALTRGSFDDISVMVIQLSHFVQ